MPVKRRDDLPYTRLGLCCGDLCRAAGRLGDVPLYRVREGTYRYRCVDCFKAETGHLP